MGLSFLNKKIWHPGSFANIEKVWIAEQKNRESERKQLENMKKLKEERQIEELKKLQVEAGLIPESYLNRLDFMYQGPECTSKINTAEEFLLGKSFKEERPEDKRHFTPVFQESYSTPQNEMFTRVHEDPMYLIMKEEMKQRKEIEENPYKIKMLLKEIEMKAREKKESKKEKKRKSKHEGSKKRRKHSGSRSSSSSSSSSSEKKNPIKITTPALLRSKLDSQTPSLYGMIDKDGKKISRGDKLIINPDEELFKERKQRLEKEAELSKRKIRGHEHNSHHSSSMSSEEKEQLRKSMEEKARIVDQERKEKIEGHKKKLEHSINEHELSHDTERSNISVLNKPGFLKSMDDEIYGSEKFDLEERVRRNKVNFLKNK